MSAAKHNPQSKMDRKTVAETVEKTRGEKPEAAVVALTDGDKILGRIECAESEIDEKLAAWIAANPQYSVDCRYKLPPGCTHILFLPEARPEHHRGRLRSDDQKDAVVCVTNEELK